MQVQKINNNQPSFSAKLNIYTAEKMIGFKQIAELKELADKVGTSEDKIDVIISSITRHDMGNDCAGATIDSYSMKALTYIRGKFGKADLGQERGAFTEHKISEVMPFEVLSKWLNELAK